MLNRSNNLATAILVAGALVTLTACGGGSKGGDTDASSDKPASPSASKDSGSDAASSAGRSDKSKGQDASKAGDKGSAGSSAKVSLPAPGDYMKVAAVGKDVIGDHQTVFYSVTEGSGRSALDTYKAALTSAGFLVEGPDADTVEAAKQGVELKLGATQSWMVNGLVILQVENGSVTLPSAPPEGDVQNAFPAPEGNNHFIANGQDAVSGNQVAFYNADSADAFLNSMKKGGYKTEPIKQDGEVIENFYKCTKDGSTLNLEVTKNPTLGGLALVSPAG